MTTRREAMDAAGKSLILPGLRAMGFKGLAPHLRRLYGNTGDLLSFQFRVGRLRPPDRDRQRLAEQLQLSWQTHPAGEGQCHLPRSSPPPWRPDPQR